MNQGAVHSRGLDWIGISITAYCMDCISKVRKRRKSIIPEVNDIAE